MCRARCRRCRAFGDSEFKGPEGLAALMAKGVQFHMWDQDFAASN